MQERCGHCGHPPHAGVCLKRGLRSGHDCGCTNYESNVQMLGESWVKEAGV